MPHNLVPKALQWSHHDGFATPRVYDQYHRHSIPLIPIDRYDVSLSLRPPHHGLDDPIRAIVLLPGTLRFKCLWRQGLFRHIPQSTFRNFVEIFCTRSTMHSIRSDVEPVDPSLVPLFITELDIEKYTQVAILTLLVYNAVITMDKEIRYFWVRVVCLISARGIRLLTMERRALLAASEDLMTILLIDCNVFLLGMLKHSSCTNCLTDIFLMRVLALYHQDKRLAVCLRTLFGLEAAFLLGIIIYDILYEEIVVGELAKGVTGSVINRKPPKVWGALSWLALLFLGNIYKAAEHWRETAGFSQFTLVKVLIQDQAIYFIMVIFCSVMQIMADQLYISNILLAYLLNTLGSTSLLSVLGSHLLVHLKEAGERGANGGTSYRMPTMSNIEFS
ncbi:hypothetical protein DFH11DRAFT_1517166 [Phellopilus nigrolimitatus]|nr:hypothetical protein DFH11DRAFT_1517166 [Phellopilus nigrolimitatus]